MQPQNIFVSLSQQTKTDMKTSLEIQKQLNVLIARRNFSVKNAKSLFNEMNKRRVSEGMEILSLPNLEKRFN